MTPKDHVAEFFQGWGRALPQKIGVAISGGSDSVALLLGVIDACPHAEISCITVDHGLRMQAKSEALFVAHLCRKLGVAHTVVALDDLRPGANLQARARDARYVALADWGRSLDVICLGHTKTDAAETFLMRLARGSGVDGLARMKHCWAKYDAVWARPLLGAAREDLQSFLSMQHQDWCTDPSNEDTSFSRVKMRNAQQDLDLLGLTTDRLAQTADRMAKVQTALDFAVAQVMPSIVSRDYCDVLIDREKLSSLPEELSERILAMVLGWVGQQVYRPRNAALLRGLTAQVTQTLHGCVIVVDKLRHVRITRELRAAPAAITAPQIQWDGRVCAPNLPEGQHLGALGATGLQQISGWRDTGVPRIALLSSPAIWHGKTVVAAPMAGFGAKDRVHIATPPWEIALTR